MSVTADIWTEFALTRRPELRERLITSYIPLVRFVVSRLGIPSTSLLEADDLVSYGIIGLINAIDRFDPSRGVRFEAFAAVRIRGAVIDRPAREEEAAAAVGVSTSRYRQMLLDVSMTVMSLDVPLSLLMQDDCVASLRDVLEDHETLGPADAVEQRELLAALSTAIDHLPERERHLLSLYYHEELTMREISKMMGVSESRVCQLHMQAVSRLRSSMSAYQASQNLLLLRSRSKRARQQLRAV